MISVQWFGLSLDENIWMEGDLHGILSFVGSHFEEVGFDDFELAHVSFTLTGSAKALLGIVVLEV